MEKEHLFINSVSSLPATDGNGLTCNDNAISSIQVVGGASVTVYDSVNFQGDLVDFLAGSYPSLSDWQMHFWDAQGRNSSRYYDMPFAQQYNYLSTKFQNWDKELASESTLNGYNYYFQNFAFSTHAYAYAYTNYKELGSDCWC
jgi:hypothetical protein